MITEMKTNDYIAAKLSTLLLLLLAYCFCAPQQACAQEETNIKVTVKLYTTDEKGKKRFFRSYVPIRQFYEAVVQLVIRDLILIL